MHPCNLIIFFDIFFNSSKPSFGNSINLKLLNVLYDFIYLICFDLSIEDRRKYEANLMQEYFDYLLGVTSDKFNMSKDEFIDDSKKALVLIYASLIIGAATSGKSGIETHALALDRFAAAIIDWGITIDAPHDRDDLRDTGNQAQL